MKQQKRSQIELVLEEECCEIARKSGIISIKMENCGHVGIPDRLFITPDGETFWVEFKTATGKLSPEQEYFQSLLVNCHVVRYVDSFRKILKFNGYE